MWFGTAGNMRWVPCPAINPRIGTEAWGESGTYLGGGAFVKSSKSSHKVYDFAWNTASREEVYSVVDYAEYVYGDGLIYFLDPFAMDQNILPAAWAQPGVFGAGSPSLLTTGAAPTVGTTPSNTLDLPTHSATYTVDNDGRELTIQVPPGYTFHFGWFGSGAGGGVVKVNGANAPSLNHNGSTLFNTTLANPEIKIELGNSGGLTIYGMIAQVLPTGQSPSATKWISGRGNSGCRFQGRPSVNGLSAALDKVSASATLVETGDWE